MNTENDEDDYSAPLSANVYDVAKNDIDLKESIGRGQFGDVYRAILYGKKGKTEIAVKTCKLPEHEESFMEEAYIMKQFDHPHIIKLVGVCNSSPPLLLLELASGQLREFLKEKGETLPLLLLLKFCHQLSSALSYLHSKKFIHRDVAARNCLIFFETNTVKLSDFGLSRWMQEHAYTLGSGKLPIKWMAPESINYRRFTESSDIFQFAVCMWEILSRGIKPWVGVSNNEISARLEDGDRLAMPVGCPPSIYRFLCKMWSYMPSERPTAQNVKLFLWQAIDEERALGDSAAAPIQPPPKPLRSAESVLTLASELEKTAALVGGGSGAVSGSTLDIRGSTSKRPQSIYEKLEQQKLQAADDEIWLNESLAALPSSPVAKNSQFSAQKRTEDQNLPINSKTDIVSEFERSEARVAINRQNDRIYEKVLELLQLVAKLPTCAKTAEISK